jgi:replication-associated recombination protein RarA
MKLTTRNGYDFFEVSSSMQKAIRRMDTKTAGYFALELWHSGYANYVWKRLFTISAEDCAGFVTKEIEALWQGHQLVNDKAKEPKGRIFVSKAVILLCNWEKSRDADHLQNLVYDKKINMSDSDINEYFEEIRKNPIPIPKYAYDVHTMQGKRMGKTKADFFKE